MSKFTGEQKLRIVLESILRDVPKKEQCKNMGSQKVNLILGMINSSRRVDRYLKTILQVSQFLSNLRLKFGSTHFIQVYSQYSINLGRSALVFLY